MAYYTIDDILPSVGEFGLFQILLQCLCSAMKVSQEMQLLLSYFTTLPSDWKCVSSTAGCSFNTTYPTNNQLRCSLPRSAWRHIIPIRDYIASEFDLVCEHKWMIEMSTSVTFLGLLFGLAIGYMADRFGRRP